MKKLCLYLVLFIASLLSLCRFNSKTTVKDGCQNVFNNNYYFGNFTNISGSGNCVDNSDSTTNIGNTDILSNKSPPEFSSSDNDSMDVFTIDSDGNFTLSFKINVIPLLTIVATLIDIIKALYSIMKGK